MHQTIRAALAATVLVIGSRSDAHAYADVSFAGLNLGGQGSGTWFDALFFGQPLTSGSSFTADFPYTITLHADGEPASRTWDFCIPLTEVDCGPPATGREQVAFDFGFEQTPEASPFTSYQISGLPTNLMVESAGTTTYRGTFSITESIAPFGTFQSLDYLVIWGATWIDSNDTLPAVPEPGTTTLVLLGLGMLALQKHARARRHCAYN